MKNNLELVSLTVWGEGKVVYNQQFHSGLNVLAGENGTGKSTVIDFVAYVLGYEEIEWKKVQKSCKTVLGNFKFGQNKFYLRREINDKKQNPIFFKNNINDPQWIVLPYKNSTEMRSFSYQLFDLLGYPQIKHESNSSLTMFNLLRLLYADQSSPTDTLLNRQKEYDTKNIRKSISEFLLGIDDLETHEIRQEINNLERIYESKNSDIKAIKTFLHEWGITSPIEISARIDEFLKSINEYTESLEKFDQNDITNNVEQNSRLQISLIDKKIMDLSNKSMSLINEISDSKELIYLLESNTSEIDESLNFYSIFSGIEFLFCPQCLKPLKLEEDKGECKLCKSDSKFDEKVNNFYLERKIEIDFQLQESKKLIEKRENQIKIIETEKSRLVIEKQSLLSLLSIQEKLTNEMIKHISSISIKIGSSEEKVRQLKSYEEKASKLYEMEEYVKYLKKSIYNKKSEIDILNESRQTYKSTIENEINEIMIRILKNDGGYETAFENPHNVYLDFSESKMSVDGSTKFSASSEAILKLASRFTIFLLSLKFEQIRIPNFSILDCMEDKGMLPDRASLIQNGILDELEKMNSENYQLIIATSMPSKRLLNEKYLIGSFLRKGEHTLNLNISQNNTQ